MSLIEDFYLLAHDNVGRPRLHARAAAIGLAAGVVAELILTGHATIQQRRLTVPQPPGAEEGTWRYAPPHDPLLQTVWDQICREPVHQVRTWLGVLAPTITEAVAARLTDAGLVRPVEVGRLRRTTRYQPIDPDTGTKIKVILGARLIDNDPTIDWPEAVLAGLLRATGLIDDILWRDHAGRGRRYLEAILAGVRQEMPAFTDLFADTEAAVGDAVLTHRT
jgi:hypothetical protein